MTIRTKLLVGTLGALLIPTIAGVLSLRRLEREMTRMVGENSAASAELLIDEIENRVYLLVGSLQEFAQTSPGMLGALEESNHEFEALGEKAIEARLERTDRAWQAWIAEAGAQPPAEVARAASHPLSAELRRKLDYHRRGSDQAFAEIFVTNRYGANVALTSPTSDYGQADERWWQEGFRTGVWIGDIDFDESSGAYSLDVVVRVDDGEQPAGVLKAVLDIGHIHSILREFESAAAFAGGETELRDPRGAVLYPTFAAPSALAGGAIELPQPHQRRHWLERSTSGSARFLRAEATGGGHAELPDLHWTVRLQYPSSIVFAPIQRIKTQLLTIGVVAGLLALVVAIIVSLGISRPIGSALEVAERIAAGDLGTDVEVVGSGEVRELLGSMRSMARKIRAVATGLAGSSDRVTELSTALSTAGREISAGAAGQSDATGHGTRSVNEMTVSIDTVVSSAVEVQTEVGTTASAVEEMTASNQAVGRNAERLATGAGETLATMRELARSVESVAAAADDAGLEAESAVRQAHAGGEAVRQTAAGVEEISSTMVEIARVNRSLGEKSERIDYITDVIEEMARKTRLLALNATLQATHAGEHGRAFRAVAEEVKALAERSSGAAKEIGDLVESVQGAIAEADSISQVGAVRAQEGVELAGRAGGAIGGVVESIEQVTDRILEIRTATGEQAGGAEQLTQTFAKMSKMTDEVAAATHQQSASTGQILDATQRLQAISDRVIQALGRHGGDSQRVQESIQTIGRVAAANVETSNEIVRITDHLETEAETLRLLGESFQLEKSPADLADDAPRSSEPGEDGEAEPSILATSAAAL